MIEAVSRTDLSDLPEKSTNQEDPKTPRIVINSDLKPKPMARKKLWSESIGAEASKKLSKQEVKRQEVIYEIITTEEDYVLDLLSIVRLYLKPLETNNLVKSKDLAVIFSNIEQILPVNQELLMELQAKQSANPVIDSVGEILIHMSDYLKIYMLYCSNYPHSVEKVTAVRQTKAVAKFLDSVASQPESRSLDLNSFLLKPVQRVCKYPLLVRDLIRATDAKHKDFEILNKALNKIEAVVTLINESTRKVENSEKVLEIQSKFTSKVSIVAPHRTLLKTGSINIDSGSSVKKREFFLFNDLLIIAKKDGAKLKMLMMAGFDEVTVTDITAEGLKLELLFKGHDALLCVFDNSTSKNEWKNLIDIAVSEWMTQGLKNRINQAHSQISPSSSQSPVASCAALRSNSPKTAAESSSEISLPKDLQNASVRPPMPTRNVSGQGSPNKSSNSSEAAPESMQANLQTKAALLKQIAQHPRAKQNNEKEVDLNPAIKDKDVVKSKPAIVKPSPASTNGMQKSVSGDKLNAGSTDKLNTLAKKVASIEKLDVVSKPGRVRGAIMAAGKSIDMIEQEVKKISSPPRSFSKEQKLEDLISKYPSDANSVRTSISIRAKNEKLLVEEVEERRSTTQKPKIARNRGNTESSNQPAHSKPLPVVPESGSGYLKEKVPIEDTEKSYVALLILTILLLLFII